MQFLVESYSDIFSYSVMCTNTLQYCIRSIISENNVVHIIWLQCLFIPYCVFIKREREKSPMRLVANVPLKYLPPQLLISCHLRAASFKNEIEPIFPFLSTLRLDNSKILLIRAYWQLVKYFISFKSHINKLPYMNCSFSFKTFKPRPFNIITSRKSLLPSGFCYSRTA